MAYLGVLVDECGVPLPREAPIWLTSLKNIHGDVWRRTPERFDGYKIPRFQALRFELLVNE